MSNLYNPEPADLDTDPDLAPAPDMAVSDTSVAVQDDAHVDDTPPLETIMDALDRLAASPNFRLNEGEMPDSEDDDIDYVVGRDLDFSTGGALTELGETAAPHRSSLPADVFAPDLPDTTQALMASSAPVQALAAAMSATAIEPPLATGDGLYVGEAPVPRISIHAFVERPATLQMLQSAGNDRRLRKAHVTFANGGIAAAIETYRTQPAANLIVVESIKAPAELLNDLDQLAEFCDAGTKVVVIGAANDIGLYRALMKRGVSEYLVPPLAPVAFVRTVASLFADTDKGFVGRSIAFLGAKGGVGSSTLSHNVAWALAERIGAATTLVDLDMSFGTTALDFNQDPTQTIVDALAAPERIDDVLIERLMVKCSDKLSILAAPAVTDRFFDFDASAYEILIDRVRRNVPYAVLDLPHSWQPWVRQTMVQSDELVIVATPELSSLRNTKNVVDVLKAARPNDAPPRIVMNMVGVPKRPEIPIKDFGDALGLEPSAIVPFEPTLFGQAANNGQMALEMMPESRSGIGIELLVSLLCGRSAPPRPKGLMDKLKLFGK